MDTKSKKFKYSIWTKLLCIILTAAMFFLFTASAIRFIMGIAVFGIRDYFSDNTPKLTETDCFSNYFLNDYNIVTMLATSDVEATQQALEDKMNGIVTDAVYEYSIQKATIIENELKYAVENYDVNYFNYEYTADLVDVPEVSTVFSQELSTSKTETVTTTNGQSVPRNIEAAQQILKICEGIDFLNFEALIRPSALTEQSFFYKTDVPINSTSIIEMSFDDTDYTYDEKEIKIYFTTQYKQSVNNIISEIQSAINHAKNQLSLRNQLMYYVVDKSGSAQLNTGSKPTIEYVKNSPAYVIYKDGVLNVKGLNGNITSVIKDDIRSMSGCEVYVFISDKKNFDTDDIYSHIETAYTASSVDNPYAVLATAGISLLLCITFLCLLLCICGKSNNTDERKTLLIDRFPPDLHFLLSFGAIIMILFVAYTLAGSIKNTNTLGNTIIRNLPVLGGMIATVAYLIFCEWITSVTRIFKAHEKFFGNMLTTKIILLIIKGFKKLGILLRKFFEILTYKPKKTKFAVVLMALFYIAVNTILSFFIINYLIIGINFQAIIAIGADIVFNAICIYFTASYFKDLDVIIQAASIHKKAPLTRKILPYSLNELTKALSDANTELQAAITKAVRDEQLKTELITNVSHDLKTPLTSLISYSDLLTKCDIRDEDAKKYIEIINTQSIKLKRLIEDLIEASKASTGNVTLKKENLNLNELAIQAITEFAPEIEAAGNEIIFTQKNSPISIFADGAKTFRILSNLLSNAKKYSASSTRIYITVFTDGENSCFEIKNVSSEPLNISPDEITERFVRGDKSRNKDGNGLGLSIAKDLCTLQNGELKISIDGDLFKATVILPSKNNTNT